MFHLYILIILLDSPLVPLWEHQEQTFDTESVCQAAGKMRTLQLNQDRNQVAGFVCLKI